MSERRDTGFLGRWSARKARARRRGRAVDDGPETESAADGKAAAPAVLPTATGESAPSDTAPENIAPPETEAELLECLGLPDPDRLGPGDDFRAFMNSAVPAALRSRALRRLWAANPVLANLDGLLDYGEDFSDGATVLPGLESAWSAGKGYARALAGADEPPEAAPAGERGADGSDIAGKDAAAPGKGGTPQAPCSGSGAASIRTGAGAADILPETEKKLPLPVELAAGASPADAPAPGSGQGRPRRMRFRFDTEETD